MSPEGRVVETELRVRYSETDRMGIVYHGAYVAWFEVGRTSDWQVVGQHDEGLRRVRPREELLS